MRRPVVEEVFDFAAELLLLPATPPLLDDDAIFPGEAGRLAVLLVFLLAPRDERGLEDVVP